MENLDEIEEFEEFELKQPYIIEKQDLSKKRNQQYDLIGNEKEETRYLLKNKWYEFNFEKPIFCSKIVYKSHNDDINGLTTIVFDGFSEKNEITIKNKETGHINVSINKVISGFKIKPPLRIMDKIYLNNIVIKGYVEEDFNEIHNQVEKYLKINDKITKALDDLTKQREETETAVNNGDEELTSIENKIRELSDTETELTASNEVLSGENTNLSSNLALNEAKLEAVDKNVESANNNLDQLKQTSTSINKDISDNTKELSRLVNNKNLFAYEVEDYVKQGNANIRAYMFLSLMPWVLICVVTWRLFCGAVEITEIFSTTLDVSIVDVLLSRLPFTLVAGAIIIVSYEISKIFVGKIIEINTQKLRFSEIGIIAKDVSSISAEGLELEDKDMYELRTKLKMDLLRHHLKKLDPEKFEYEINPSLWDKYRRVFFGDSKPKKEDNKTEEEKG